MRINALQFRNDISNKNLSLEICLIVMKKLHKNLNSPKIVPYTHTHTYIFLLIWG